MRTIITNFTIGLAVLFFHVSCAEKVNTAKLTTDDGIVYWYTNDYPALHQNAWAYSNYIDTPELSAADRNNTYLRGIFFNGPDYRGHETRFFAWIGVPRVSIHNKIPAIVLVHGGGGTAYESWVRLWNAKGYAAIAMDHTGGRPVGAYPNWQRDEYSSPANNSTSMFSPILPDNEQWQYFAIESIKRSVSILTDFEQIDASKIGITGVSWGGYLVCALADNEPRIKFGIPVYGCGNLYSGSLWNSDLVNLNPAQRSHWIDTWDPARNLKASRFPIHWVTGITDPAYYMSAIRLSYENMPTGLASASFYKKLPHGHGGPGEKPGEIFAFADACTGKGPGLPRIKSLTIYNRKLHLDYEYSGKLNCTLFYSESSLLTPDTQWMEVQLPEGNPIDSDLPISAVTGFVNLVNEKSLISSSRLFDVN